MILQLFTRFDGKEQFLGTIKERERSSGENWISGNSFEYDETRNSLTKLKGFIIPEDDFDCQEIEIDNPVMIYP